MASEMDALFEPRDPFDVAAEAIEKSKDGPKDAWSLFGVECGKGWRCLVQPLLELCKLHNVTVLQVKEKFGGLCFYVGGGDFDLSPLINAAEDASYHICEDCGENGQAGWDQEKCQPIWKATTARSETSSWLRTLCTPCRNKWDDDRDLELKRFIRDTAGSS